MIRNMKIGVRSAVAFGILGIITFLLGKLRLRSRTAVSVSNSVKKVQNVTDFSTFSP